MRGEQAEPWRGACTHADSSSLASFDPTRPGFEVGRLPTEAAVWVSKLMDLDMAEFEGYVVDCPPVLSVGCDILLDIKVSGAAYSHLTRAYTDSRIAIATLAGLPSS